MVLHGDRRGCTMAVMAMKRVEADRTAPGALELVREFLNTPAVEPTEEELRVAEAIRREGRRGEAQATLAARYGVGQQLVSAILRGKRLVRPRSRAGDVGATTIGSAASMRRWLAARGFIGRGDALGPRAQARVLELQRVLLAMALSNGGAELPAGAPAALGRLASETPMVAVFGDGVSLAPARAGIDGFIGTIIASVYDAMRDGSWARLKACPADRCHHVFFDTSRNRTSTWCSMSICGNRTKVRNVPAAAAGRAEIGREDRAPLRYSAAAPAPASSRWAAFCARIVDGSTPTHDSTILPSRSR